MSFEKFHWRYYFGGVALLILLLQLGVGVFLALFYQPHLNEAYLSVQGFYKSWDAPVGAWLRDVHRWGAFFLFFALVIHVVRSLLRKDFLNFETRSRVIWLTGGLLLLPMGALLLTGFVLPWDWKGYWWMEMIANYFGFIPYIGLPIKQFLIDAFTMNRNFVAHVVILPAVSIVLLDIHIFSKVRKRKGGIPRYLRRHILLSIPFFIIIAALAVYLSMPTADPEMIPTPLEGENIPMPEWFLLIFFVPFMHFKDALASFLGIYLAFALYLGLVFLPYFFKRSGEKAEKHEPGGDIVFKEFRHVLGKILKIGFMRKLVGFVTVLLTAGTLFGFLYYETYPSPTLGCNSCHNIAMGSGIGSPPENFKDRSKEPKLDNSLWMIEHWFYPQQAW